MRIPDGAILVDGDSHVPIDPANLAAFKAMVESDIEQFAALAQMGHHAVRETPIDVVIDVDPAFAGLVATTIVEGEWWLDGAPIGAPIGALKRAIREARLRALRDGFRIVDLVRRRSIRAAARARKARRGWR